MTKSPSKGIMQRAREMHPYGGVIKSRSRTYIVPCDGMCELCDLDTCPSMGQGAFL